MAPEDEARDILRRLTPEQFKVLLLEVRAGATETLVDLHDEARPGADPDPVSDYMPPEEAPDPEAVWTAADTALAILGRMTDVGVHHPDGESVEQMRRLVAWMDREGAKEMRQLGLEVNHAGHRRGSRGRRGRH